MNKAQMANVKGAAIMHNGQWLKISDRDEVNNLKGQVNDYNGWIKLSTDFEQNSPDNLIMIKKISSSTARIVGHLKPIGPANWSWVPKNNQGINGLGDGTNTKNQISYTSTYPSYSDVNMSNGIGIYYAHGGLISANSYFMPEIFFSGIINIH